MKAIVFTWYNCNESCFFCSAEVHGRKDSNRSFLEIAHDIDHAHKQWMNEIEFIWWEVLIRPDIFLIIAFAKKKNFHSISIETNGTILADIAFTQKILALWLNKITLSIHGNSSEINDRHTWLKGSFDKKILALKNLQSFHGKYWFSVATNYVITSKNVAEIPGFVKRMEAFPMLEKYIFAFVRPLQSYHKLYRYYLPNLADIRNIFGSMQLYPKIAIQYLPLCILDNEKRQVYQEIFLKWQKENTKKSNSLTDTVVLESAIQNEMVYIEWCQKCELRNSCRWIWREYVDFFHIQNTEEIAHL